MRLAAGIEYDGAGFHGWQLQLGVRTVQECVEEALSRVAAHPMRVTVAGRTDAGVHASAQVVHFDSDADRDMRAWVFGANRNLPPDVRILWARPVTDAFHARFSAHARHYRYTILNRPVRPSLNRATVAWWYRPLDEVRMAEAGAYLVGEHDFSSYRALACQAKGPVRTIRYLRVHRRGDRVVIQVCANAFLHHMVRNIAGVLMTVGSGERPPEWAREVLEYRDRTRGGVTAAPYGLCLVGIEYPGEFGIPEGEF